MEHYYDAEKIRMSSLFALPAAGAGVAFHFLRNTLYWANLRNNILNAPLFTKDEIFGGNGQLWNAGILAFYTGKLDFGPSNVYLKDGPLSFQISPSSLANTTTSIVDDVVHLAPKCTNYLGGLISIPNKLFSMALSSSEDLTQGKELMTFGSLVMKDRVLQLQKCSKNIPFLLCSKSREEMASYCDRHLMRNLFIALIAGSLSIGGIYLCYRIISWRSRDPYLSLEMYMLRNESSRIAEKIMSKEEREGGYVCCLCLVTLPHVVLEPCGHCCICITCLDEYFIHSKKTCPICREPFEKYQPVLYRV